MLAEHCWWFLPESEITIFVKWCFITEMFLLHLLVGVQLVRENFFSLIRCFHLYEYELRESCFFLSTACCFQLIFMLRLITLSHLWPWRSPLWSIRLCPLTLLIILGGCSAFCPLFQAHCGPGSPHASLAPVLEQLFFQRALVPLSGRGVLSR